MGNSDVPKVTAATASIATAPIATAPIEILSATETLVVIAVDGTRCNFKVAAPFGQPMSFLPTSLVVNANYFEPGTPEPVGYYATMANRGSSVPNSLPLPPDKPRTVLLLHLDGSAEFTDPMFQKDTVTALSKGQWDDAIVVQPGPRLLRSGNIVSGDPENFAGSGALARADHVAIGTQSGGKILVMYAAARIPSEVAQLLLDYEARDAVKCDGGAGAYLKFGNLHRGIPWPKTALFFIAAT